MAANIEEQKRKRYSSDKFGENEKRPIANPDNAVHLFLRSFRLGRRVLRGRKRSDALEGRHDSLRDLPVAVARTLHDSRT